MESQNQYNRSRTVQPVRYIRSIYCHYEFRSPMLPDEPTKPAPEPAASVPPASMPPASTGGLDRRVIPSSELFVESREVWIQHGQEIYRLRLTKNGKLILHK